MEIVRTKIALIQMSVSPDPQVNYRKVDKFTAEAVERGAKIIFLPELFSATYFAQYEDDRYLTLAESIPGPSSKFLSNLASKYGVTVFGGSLFERTPDRKYYNTTLVHNSQGICIGKYRKMHIPHDPSFFEQKYFQPGDLGYIRVKTEGLVISPLICYDQWFPEPARIAALGGAHLICYPTAIGWTDDMKKYEPFSADRWEQAMCAHASMNGIYTAAINRVGIEDGLDFWGGSFVADPFGRVIEKASDDREELLVVGIDTERIFDSQNGWMFIQNRRPDSYSDICKDKSKKSPGGSQEN